MDKVVLLEGNLASRKGELKKIKRSLTDYELFTFDKEDSYDYVAQMVSELSCFGSLRLFIIKSLPNIEAPDESQARAKVLNRFKKFFPSIPNGNLVIFDNVGVSSASFFKEVRKHGKVFVFDQKIKKSEAVRKINTFLKNKKIEFNNDDTSLIVDSLNMDGAEVDLDKFYLLMRKIYNYISSKKKLTNEDVLNVCDTSKDFIIWNFYNLLDSRDFCKSSILINDYLSNAKNFNYESEFLLKGMTWRYGLFLMIKNGINDKKSQDEIFKEVSILRKLEREKKESDGKTKKGRNMKMTVKKRDNNNLPEYSEKMLNNTLGRGYGRSSLSCYEYGQLLLIYYSLIKTQIKIRAGCTDSEIKIAIHVILLVICGMITKKNTIDGILEHKKMIYRG